MTVAHIALIRGINVGPAKRVAMADLRALVEDLGYSDVRTLLNSGNVVFTAPRAQTAKAAAAIEKALAGRLGVSARTIVLSGRQLRETVEENPLLEISDNPSRLMVAFLADPGAGLKRLEPLLKENWFPEALSLGKRVAFIWMPAGVRASRLNQEVARVLDDSFTVRNWATVLKIYNLVK